MKRIVLWGLSTLSAVGALLGYHTSTSSVMATAPESAISGSLRAQAASGAGPSTGSGTGSGSSATGDSVATPYGPVQVQVDVTGTTITDVTVLQYPDRDGHSVQINQYALPRLINQTIDAQGSDISMVSGATYTSQGYLQSLQSALDQAGL